MSVYIPTVEIRLGLFIEGCICGARLQRGEPLPEFGTYPDSETGRSDAKASQTRLQDYINKTHAPAKGERKTK